MTFWNPGDTVNFILFSPYVALKGEGFICRCISSPWRIELVLATLLAEVFSLVLLCVVPFCRFIIHFSISKPGGFFQTSKERRNYSSSAVIRTDAAATANPDANKNRIISLVSVWKVLRSDTGYSFITTGYHHHNLEYLFCIFDESIRLIFVSSKLWGLCCGYKNLCKQGQTNFVCKWNGLVVKSPKVEMHHVVPFCKLGQSGQLERCVWCRATLFT